MGLFGNNIRYGYSELEERAWVEGFDNLFSPTKVKIKKKYKGFPVTLIKRGAFEDCSTLVSVTLPDSVTKIDVSAFENCKNLKKIDFGKNLQTLKYRAFFGCRQLAFVHFPKTLTEIESGVWENCYALKSFSVEKGNPVYRSFDGVLYSADGSRLLHFPVKMVSDGFSVPPCVRFISYGAIHRHDFKLNEYKNGYYVGRKDNPYYALVYMDELPKRDFANLFSNNAPKHEIHPHTKIIADGAFKYSGVKRVDLQGVEIVGNFAFENCKDLELVIMPYKVSAVGEDAFLNCPQAHVLLEDAYSEFTDNDGLWETLGVPVYHEWDDEDTDAPRLGRLYWKQVDKGYELHDYNCLVPHKTGEIKY